MCDSFSAIKKILKYQRSSTLKCAHGRVNHLHCTSRSASSTYTALVELLFKRLLGGRDEVGDRTLIS